MFINPMSSIIFIDINKEVISYTTRKAFIEICKLEYVHAPK